MKLASLWLALLACQIVASSTFAQTTATLEPIGTRSQSDPLTIMVPAYFYPAEEGLQHWDRLLDSAKSSEIIAIVNPASGPGKQTDSNYQTILKRASDTKLIPIGYVTLSYGKRDVGTICAEIDLWLKLYPGIQGIFLDEQPSAATYVDEQQQIYQYVRETKSLNIVVSNPGTVCDPNYLALPTTDIVCLYEGSDALNGIRIPTWTEKVKTTQVCALAYGIATQEQMRSLARLCRRQQIGTILITDASGENPWRGLPSYWKEFIKECAGDSEIEIQRQE
jgi:hypothetical protein